MVAVKEVAVRHVWVKLALINIRARANRTIETPTSVRTKWPNIVTELETCFAKVCLATVAIPTE